MNSIAPSILVLAALACILMALALWLFTRARQQEGQKSLLSNLQRNLERNQDATTPPPFPAWQRSIQPSEKIPAARKQKICYSA